jgi:hypothetical protein
MAHQRISFSVPHFHVDELPAKISVIGNQAD